MPVKTWIVGTSLVLWMWRSKSGLCSVLCEMKLLITFARRTWFQTVHVILWSSTALRVQSGYLPSRVAKCRGVWKMHHCWSVLKITAFARRAWFWTVDEIIWNSAALMGQSSVLHLLAGAPKRLAIPDENPFLSILREHTTTQQDPCPNFHQWSFGALTWGILIQEVSDQRLFNDMDTV